MARKPKIGTILQQSTTHKAVVSERGIDIVFKGHTFEAIDGNDTVLSWPDEIEYSIPLENRDDLFAIFEQIEETIRYEMDMVFSSIKTITP
jgi:hypothetical protein